MPRLPLDSVTQAVGRLLLGSLPSLVATEKARAELFSSERNCQVSTGGQEPPPPPGRERIRAQEQQGMLLGQPGNSSLITELPHHIEGEEVF